MLTLTLVCRLHSTLVLAPSVRLHHLARPSSRVSSSMSILDAIAKTLNTLLHANMNASAGSPSVDVGALVNMLSDDRES